MDRRSSTRISPSSEAEAFFDGSTLALGIFAAGDQTVDLSYLLTAAGDPPGFSVIYGLEGLPTGSPVPEPSTWAMLIAEVRGSRLRQVHPRTPTAGSKRGVSRGADCFA